MGEGGIEGDTDGGRKGGTDGMVERERGREGGMEGGRDGGSEWGRGDGGMGAMQYHRSTFRPISPHHILTAAESAPPCIYVMVQACK